MIGLRTAVIPLALCLGGARAFDDGLGWHQPQETVGNLAKIGGVAPLATAAPDAKLLFKRGTNTCGYIDGDASQAVTCRADLGAECLYESGASAIGCCATTSCDIWTACLPRTSSDATSTADMDRTRYCSNTASPHCAVYLWKDPKWTGYTMAICDSVSTTYSFFPSPQAIADGETTTTSRRRSSSSSSTTTSSSSTTTKVGPTSTTAEPGGGGAPVGAIVGGVIGGVAVLALLGVGLFFILRRLKQNNNVPPVAPVPQQMAAAPPGPQGPPQYPYSPDPNMKPQMYSGVPSSVPSMYGPPPGQMPPPGPDGQNPGGFYYNQLPHQDPRMSMASATPISPTSYGPSVAGATIAGAGVGVAAGYAAGQAAYPGQSPVPGGQEFHTPDQAYAAHNVPYQPPQQEPSPPLPQQAQTPPVVQAYQPPPAQGGYAQDPYAQGGYGPKPGAAAPVELPTARPDGELRELA